MKPLPFPIRVAAGLAATTAERVRELPKQLTGLPVTMASQVLQASMRVQQQVTELAIKGDDALSTFRPVEETPGWATFDEDLDTGANPFVPTPSELDAVPGEARNGHRHGLTDPDTAADPWTAEEQALAEDHADGEFDSVDGGSTHDTAPAGVADYDELTLPQLRARLRTYSLDQLEQLLAYERAHADRPSIVGMLTRRIGNVRNAPASGDENPQQQ